MEVDFVTLGDVSKRLDVPSPTLRNWTDQLEEMGVHYVKRNNRNERVYYDTDIEIFMWLRDLKKEYGRKTTMRDLTNMMGNMTDRFTFRSEEDAPTPTQNPSNKTGTGDLITADDVQRLMENQRVRAVIGYIITESTEQLRGELMVELREQLHEERDVLKLALREELKAELKESNSEIFKELKAIQEGQKQIDQEERKRIAERDEELMKNLREMQESQKEKEKEKEQEKKGFIKRLFG